MFLLMNAAGSCLTMNHAERLARSASTHGLIGSVTKYSREGNGESNFYYDEVSGNAINNRGMPQRGMEQDAGTVQHMCSIFHQASKEAWVSIAGETTSEYEELAQFAIDSGADGIELNFGCPHRYKHGKQQRIFSFDPLLLQATCTLVAEKIFNKAVLAVKLSPYSDPEKLRQVALLLRECKGLHYVVTSNTFPNALLYQDGKPAIPMVLGGLSGKAMKPIALGQAYQFRQLLPAHIDVIVAGGITNPSDVHDAILAGASGVQVGTEWFCKEDPRIFGELGTAIPESLLEI